LREVRRVIGVLSGIGEIVETCGQRPRLSIVQVYVFAVDGEKHSTSIQRDPHSMLDRVGVGVPTKSAACALA
jgi:hypothetical protein